MNKILIVEDEAAIRMALEDDFTLAGYQVKVAGDGHEGFATAMTWRPDLILLDVMLPGMDGIEVCRALRQRENEVPIIMLTAKGQEVDRIVGLEIGADDYVTKPFSPRELQARVKAILRRSSATRPTVRGFGNIEIDLDGHNVRKDGQPINLTALEFSLLRYFLAHHGRVLTRDEILDAVWGEDVIVDARTVDTHVANLRRKLERDPAHPQWLLGVRGVGYKLVVD
ncbi:MAG: response regulator transcription factor [Saprospiraceae bacterium]|nr:response regulator transcription factor [Saprospiraceae bacterium]